MIDYVVYNKDNVQEAADIALKNRLYVSGWELSYLLKNIREFTEYHKKCKISLAYENNTPIGICVCDNKEIQVFVRKSKRKQGIGTALIKNTIGNSKKNFYHKEGVSYSLDFFNKVKNKLSNPNQLEYYYH